MPYALAGRKADRIDSTAVRDRSGVVEGKIHVCGICGRACAGALECVDRACEQPVQQLVLGSTQSCALHRAGTAGPRLRCWGENSSGFFRDSNVAPYWDLPHDVLEVPAARSMALSDSHRCVVLPGGDLVRCWGSCDVECGAPGNTNELVLNEVPAERYRAQISPPISEEL